MSTKTPLMTPAETACFKTARALQREDLLHELKWAFIPTLPLYTDAIQRSFSTQIVYFSIVLAGLPIILLFRLIRILFTVLLFPYRYLSTYRLPGDFKPPGERNIQGMHTAFSKYVNLSTLRYVSCINRWIKILYGEKAAKNYKLQDYFDTRLLKEHDLGVNAADHLRDSLRQARENISRKLGYYS